MVFHASRRPKAPGPGASARKKASTRTTRRSSRDDYIPVDFLEVLRSVRPELCNELIKTQVSLAYLAWVSPSKLRRHKAVEGAMTISYKELNQRFSRRRFHEINDRLRIFDVSRNWSKAYRATRAFRLRPDVQQAVDEYFDRCDAGLISLITAEGDRLRTVPKAVASKNMDGITTKAWREATILNKVPVDRDALLALRQQLRRISNDDRRLASFADRAIDENAATIAYYLDVVGRVLQLSRTDVAGAGYLMHRYVEHTSGRLYACNFNLQTVPRLIKQVALHGLWEYDFANCHYALFAQLAVRYEIRTPLIANYLKHKRATRQGLAERNGLTVEEAKTCLLAILYGARSSEWHKAAIPETIGPQRARRLYHDPWFKSLMEEIDATRTALVAAWPHQTAGYVVNEVGCGIPAERAAKYVLAHLLQGAEAKMLRSIIDAFPGGIVLLQHDGFAGRSRLDVAAITKIVNDATGYAMGVEEVLLTLPKEVERSILPSVEFRQKNSGLSTENGCVMPVNGPPCPLSPPSLRPSGRAAGG